MATLTDLTTGIQTVTATGAVTPTAGVDISGMTGDATLCIEVLELTSGATAAIQVEDTVNAFTAVVGQWIEQVAGQMGATSWTQGAYNPLSQKGSVRKYQLPNMRLGTASGKARVNVTQLTGTSPSLTLHAWIEN